MSEERRKSKLVDLTLTFDGTRINPDRFKPDPLDHTRPDPKSYAPSREHMTSAQAAELVRLGNLNYAAFIQDCRAAAGAKTRKIAGLPARPDHRLFLNKDEVGIDDEEPGIGGVTFQNPYSAILSCIDARVPAEVVTGQATNDTFVIRTAGNTLPVNGDASGSLRYILSNYGRGSKGEHETVTAVFIIGHTRCGAVKAAYDAFKPRGGGLGDMHPSLANLLMEIKPAVDLILGAGGQFGSEDDIKNAISFANAALTAKRAEQMASDLKVGAEVKVYATCYHVDDFYLRPSNFAQEGTSRFAALSVRRGQRAFALDETGGLLDEEARKALVEDALDFVGRR